MKFFLVVNANLPANAMAIFPFILIKNKQFVNDPILINHEKIHLKQQLELLILPFYIIYLLHYVINLVRYKNHYNAYSNIIFEKEAFTNDGDFSYLEERKPFAWVRFLR